MRSRIPPAERGARRPMRRSEGASFGSQVSLLGEWHLRRHSHFVSGITIFAPRLTAALCAHLKTRFLNVCFVLWASMVSGEEFGIQ